MTDLQKFIEEHQNVNTMFDSEKYRGQCTQIVKRWAEANGWPIPNSGGSDHAVDYKNFSNGYKFIYNTPEGMPKQGDIVIWDERIGNGDGHVAIYIGGDLFHLDCFEQNWPRGSTCHIQQHSYSCVLGWLTPIVANENPPQPPQSNNGPAAVPAYQFGINLFPGLRKNSEVAKLQDFLKSRGYFPQDIDSTGNYLNITKDAVTRLQVDLGVVTGPDEFGAGYFGPKTREKVNAI